MTVATTTHPSPTAGDPTTPEPARERRVTAAPIAPRLPGVVFVLTLTALLLRVAVILFMGDPSAPGAMEHRSLAQSLLLGDGFAFNDAGGYTENGLYEPSSVQSPPYPLLLAGLFTIFGVDQPAAWFAAFAINAILGAATVPFVYLLAREAGGSDSRGHVVGLLAAAAFAVWPTQLFAVTQAQAVVAIVLSVVAISWLWLVSLRTGRLGPWVAYSAVGCLAALTEPVLLPAMFLSGCWVLVTRRLPADLRLRNGIILLATALAFIGPWTWRNYRVHDAFMPIKSTFWVNVWKGNNATDPSRSGTDRPALTGERLERVLATGRDELRQYDLLTEEQRIRLDGRRAVEREAIFGEWTKAWIRDNPLLYAGNCGKRLLKTLFWDWDHPNAYRALYVYPASRTFLTLATLAGIVVAWRSRWRLAHVALIAGVAVLTYTLTVTAARFATPLEPYQMLLAALVVVAALRVRPCEVARPGRVTDFLGTRQLNDGSA